MLGIFNKKSLSASEQIELLKQRGLIIKNTKDAENILKTIGYYRLSSYMRNFQIDKDHNFRQNTAFEEIINLYHFDQKLRQITFSAIEKIEIAYRASISNVMCKAFDSHWFCNAKCLTKNANICDICDLIEKEITKIKKGDKYAETFITNYYNKYSAPKLPPFWMVAETFSMGTLNYIFHHIDFKYRNNIMQELGFQLDYKFMSTNNWLYALNVVRNICAHHSRLFNRVFRISPTKHSRVIEFSASNTTFYYIAMIIDYYSKILSNDILFENEIISLLSSHPTIDKTKMGFPKNWTRFTYTKVSTRPVTTLY